MIHEIMFCFEYPTVPIISLVAVGIVLLIMILARKGNGSIERPVPPEMPNDN